MTDYTLTQLPWLATAFERFAKLCYQNQHSHAQLIPVDIALGGIELATEMAKMALCIDKTPLGACGICKACLLCKAGNHPDLHWVRSDGNQIKVDQIRELCRSLLHTAQQSGARVAVIEQSERMNIAAANALLKTLEEPGANTLLLLQTDTPASLLPTITSRCQKISFTHPTKTHITDWLDALDLLPIANAQGQRHDVTWCLGVVGGPLKLAASLQSQHYPQLLEYRQDWSTSLQSGHLQNSLLKLTDIQIIDALKVLYLYLRQYVLKSNKLNPLIQSKLIELAGDVMHMTHKLATMANVNTQALCQNYVLKFRHVLALS